MSELKVQQPIVHTPKIEKWGIQRHYLLLELKRLEIDWMPKDFTLDNWYYYCSLSDWGKILYDLAFSSNLYKKDIFDCPIAEDLAWALGFFYAEGWAVPECRQWGIGNTQLELLEKCIKPFEAVWKDIYFVILTNAKNRKTPLCVLKPRLRKDAKFGQRNEFIKDFRQMFYTDAKLKKIPGCILESTDEARKAFLDGVIEGDGCKKCHYVTTKGQPGMIGLYLLMRDLRLAPVVRRRGQTDLFNIYYQYWHYERDQAILNYLYERNGRIPASKLSKDLNINSGTLTWILDRLERETFIKSFRPKSRRRNVELVPMPHCQDYALKAQIVCAERYGLNAIRFCIGLMPLGAHGFNLFFHGDKDGIEGVMLWEPNDGFRHSGEAFEIGQHEYFPKLVLI